MPRKKKPTYEYVERLNRYRKRIKGPDGKYISVYGTTPDELTRKLAIATEQIRDEIYHRENPTVAEYATHWLETHNVRATTKAEYGSKIKVYIAAPPLGNLYMAEVTPDDLKATLAVANQKSNSVYRGVHFLLKQIFSSAEASGVIDHSPADNLKPKGGKPAKERQALTAEQTDILLDTVRNLPVYPFVMLGLYAGLRREEILALQWDSVYLDVPAPYLTVRRAWHIEHNRPIITPELKTKAAKRSIPIPSPLLDCLRAVKSHSTSAYVIASRDGTPLTGTQWRQLWKYVTTRSTKERTYTRCVNGQKIKHTVSPALGSHSPHNRSVVYRIDFPVTPHQLRHTYITNLIRSGVDVKSVQYLAGHEHSKITLDIYSHVVYNRPEDMAQKVTAAFPA